MWRGLFFLGGVNPTKTDEMIEMSFVDSGGPNLGYHVLGGARIPPGGRVSFFGGGISRSADKYIVTIRRAVVLDR